MEPFILRVDYEKPCKFTLLVGYENPNNSTFGLIMKTRQSMFGVDYEKGNNSSFGLIMKTQHFILQADYEIPTIHPSNGL